MAIFTKSIRWRLLFWLGFLLACILSGFGVTAYQLHRITRISHSGMNGSGGFGVRKADEQRPNQNP